MPWNKQTNKQKTYVIKNKKIKTAERKILKGFDVGSVYKTDWRTPTLCVFKHFPLILSSKCKPNVNLVIFMKLNEQPEMFQVNECIGII